MHRGGSSGDGRAGEEVHTRSHAAEDRHPARLPRCTGGERRAVACGRGCADRLGGGVIVPYENLKVNGESLHPILSFSGSICPLPFSKVFHGLPEGTNPRAFSPTTSIIDFEVLDSPSPLRRGFFAVAVSSSDTPRRRVARGLDVR